MTSTRRVAVIGGGITGVVAAHRLVQLSDDVAAVAGAPDHGSVVDEVVLFERSHRLGGRLAGTPFAGLDHVDSGADAFLARVPDARDLAVVVGLGDSLVHPEPVGAAIWHDTLHDIPAGLVLGVPSNPLALARSGLLSPRGMARAAIEPLLPRTSLDADSIGDYVRARFGDEVHERLVDALVGSIYATDTDRFSLAEIPQLAALTGDRSLLVAARRIARKNAGTASAAAAPIFATPRRGMAQLAAATADAFARLGGTVRTGATPMVRRDPGRGAAGASGRWRVDDELFDAIVLAVPAAAATPIIEPTDSDLARRLASAETADVVMVTLHIGSDEFPDRLRGRSGYLVPKPVQRDVTAVSFGSQKWAHWAPPDGGEIVRVSLGRDGAPVMHLSDDEIIERVMADLTRHLDVAWTPIDTRITRWEGAFAQYRPHHRRWVDDMRSQLPAGIHLAGSSYDGIGVPACVRSGKTIAERAVETLADLAS